MRLFSVIILMLFSLNTYAKVEVTCFSGGEKFFNKIVKDAYVGEGFVVAEDKIVNYIITGECIIKFPLK